MNAPADLKPDVIERQRAASRIDRETERLQRAVRAAERYDAALERRRRRSPVYRAWATVRDAFAAA